MSHYILICKITQDYCYNNDYGNCDNCDIAKNNNTYLKPCPFCGGEAIIQVKDWDNKVDGYKVACSSCGIMQENYVTEKINAVTAWNKRVGDK